MNGATVEGSTVSIGTTLVESATLKISEWCNSRRLNSVDWYNTRGIRNIGATCTCCMARCEQRIVTGIEKLSSQNHTKNFSVNFIE